MKCKKKILIPFMSIVLFSFVSACGNSGSSHNEHGYSLTVDYRNSTRGGKNIIKLIYDYENKTEYSATANITLLVTSMRHQDSETKSNFHAGKEFNDSVFMSQGIKTHRSDIYTGMDTLIESVKIIDVSYDVSPTKFYY